MFMSILHRATGVFLALGFVAFTWGLLAVAGGSEAYSSFLIAAAHPFGRLVLFGFSYSLIYHAMNGVRHLWWDAGRGYDLDAVRKSGWLIMVLSVVATIVLWYCGYQNAGLISGMF